ncbi:hypothetical protein HRI_005164900 [Hibiscus trionum]|uniref:WRKY domain-containing protein n=1 Tax=Hibiscus trionum TaxID=183268 RepID=A0A9W7JKH7_HIBTR|nr:hypothetical protein HRI_005164900 [Hibiscus trionum]
MAADWDLYAVVRSCKSAVNKASSAVASNRSLKANNSYTGCNCLASLKLGEEDDPFIFSNLSKKGYLQDSHNPFLTQADPTAVGSNRGKGPSFFSTADGGSSGQHHQLQPQQPQPQPQQPLNITMIPAPVFSFSQFVNQRPPKPRPKQPEVPRPRTRKRKNKNQKRTVCQVTGENLWSDQWSWRKYGQKPIKGSPHPRHYYRCSSSKGCSARKHVERSNSDPDIFIVTYTGDHIHPKPTYRNSHAGGSRRNRLSKPANASSSSSIPQTTPLSAPEDGATVATAANAGDNGVKEGGNVNNVALETSPVAENYDDEEVILIPNAHVIEDLFEGLMRGAGGGSGFGLGPTWPAFGGNFSSWGTGNSAPSDGSAAGRG